jgi:hypothetical protein
VKFLRQNDRHPSKSFLLIFENLFALHHKVAGKLDTEGTEKIRVKLESGALTFK